MRIWTEQERQKQRERIRAQKPWLKSTGPKTEAGKTICKMNARKHGAYDMSMMELRKALRAQARFVRMVNLYIAFQKQAYKIKKSGN